MSHHLVRIAPPVRPRTFAGALVLALLAAVTANADTYDWNGSTTGGGTGVNNNWNTTDANWTGFGTVWPAAGTDNDAVFGGTAGTVTISGGVTANDVSFTTTGYTIAASTLTLNGATPTITVDPNLTATISAQISGGAGLTKAGNGTLILTGANNYTGGSPSNTAVSAGTLQIGNGVLNGTYNGTYGISSGATLRLARASTTPLTWSNFTGAGTLSLSTATNNNPWGDSTLTSGFTGTLQIESGRVSPASGGGGGLGNATSVVVQAGGQLALYNFGAATVTQNLTIAGTGYGESGYESALRPQSATVSGSVTLASSATIGAGGTISGVISGGSAANLTLGTANQAGTIIFSGANTYSGNTTVAFGSLTLSGGANRLYSSGVTATSDVTVNSTFNVNGQSQAIDGLSGAGSVTLGAGTLSVGGGDGSSSFTGIISGTGGSLTKTGNGTLTLTGANSYTAGTTVSLGILEIGNGVANGTLNGAYSISSGATLRLNRAAQTAITNIYSGTGTLSLNVAGTSNGNAATYDWGTPVLTGFSGSLVLEEGRLDPTSPSSLGGTTSVEVLSGGQLMLFANSNGQSYSQNLKLAGTGWGEAGQPGALRYTTSVGAVTTTVAGTVTLTAPATVYQQASGSNGVISGTITNGGFLLTAEEVSGGMLTFSNTISGNGGLTQAGPGTLVLSGANSSYTGTTSVTGGVLSVATLAPNASISGIGSGTAVTLNGGTLRYTGGDNGNNTLSTQFNRSISVGASGGTIDIAGTGFLFYNGALTGNGTLSVIDSSGDANNRQLLLTSNNPSFSGNIAIGNGTANSGWLQQRSNAASPLGTGTVTLNTGGILSADNGATAPTTLSNNLIFNGGTLLSQAAPMNYTGTVTVNTSTTSFLQPTGSANITLSGNISGTGTISQNAGGFSVVLAGNNSSFNGTYNHSGAGAAIFNTVNSGSAAAAWTLASNANARYMANVAGTIHLGSLAGTTGRVENLANVASTFSIGALNSNTAFSGTIQNGTGTLSIAKVGSGTLTLGGTNTYSGITSITAGTLVVNGSHTTGGLYSVSGGATLSGDGSTTSAVTLAASAILAPGTSPGSLGTGLLTLDNASILNWELAAPNLGITTTSDRVDVTGNLILDGVLNVTALTGFGTPVAGDRWRLFNYTSGLTNNTLTLGTLPALTLGLQYSIDTVTNGQVDLLVSVVPEPSSFAMLLFGSVMLWLVGRKRIV